MKLTRFKAEENQQLREIESIFNDSIKTLNLKYDYIAVFIITALISLTFKIQTSLDINMHLFLLLIGSSLLSTLIIIYISIADKLKLINGNNFIIIFLSNLDILKLLVYTSSISSGIITGALIKNIYINSFRIFDLLYVLYVITTSMLCIYVYKLVIPITILLQDRCNKPSQPSK